MSLMDKTPREQIALSLLIENAFEVFDKGLMAVAGRMILWGSFDEAEQLAKRYLQADGRAILDKRRHANPDLTKEGFLFGAEIYALEALEYKKWAKERDGQPIYYEALVTYCASLENFLKTVAVGFYLSKGNSLDGQIYVPLKRLAGAYKAIGDAWERGCDRSRRVQDFYENWVVRKTPAASSYIFSEISDSSWADTLGAFKLRNAIVHGMARLSEDVSIGESYLRCGVLELNQGVLKYIAQNFRNIALPFDPNHGY